MKIQVKTWFFHIKSDFPLENSRENHKNARYSSGNSEKSEKSVKNEGNRDKNELIKELRLNSDIEEKLKKIMKKPAKN